MMARWTCVASLKDRKRSVDGARFHQLLTMSERLHKILNICMHESRAHETFNESCDLT